MVRDGILISARICNSMRRSIRPGTTHFGRLFGIWWDSPVSAVCCLHSTSPVPPLSSRWSQAKVAPHCEATGRPTFSDMRDHRRVALDPCATGSLTVMIACIDLTNIHRTLLVFCRSDQRIGN